MVYFISIVCGFIVFGSVLFTLGYRIGFKEGMQEEKEKLITSIMTEQ
jgi:hypothetical protein